jgi:Uncharacterized conserved protein
VDEKAQKLWNQYSKYEQLMLAQTHTEKAPWIIIDADDSSIAYLNALEHILKSVLIRRNGGLKRHL